ncbi:TetR family transcriptional regulator [Insulibacter thermoxylanivorax]|uniref:TetR family transcriptional regulator n=1 Tax=Insulibacter thermoxylanivorax TaxID=2749268 RepID=A0A916QGX7_9BACL|nr:TetR/AcrR family transcriptional regulator [Insulibacter thermoxylanivorax]GFR38679.1 TetR family transcriptional regulator [Insulibacter thermoxylanivorax]
MKSDLSTSDKLLSAAIDLMAEKGYHATTTKEIAAAAGVNEVTLFRHFGSKQKLLEAAFDRYHYGDEMMKLFKEKLEGELHPDLLLISRTYHTIMTRNRKMIMIGIREAGSIPGVDERASRHPQKLKQLLTEYFTAMQQIGKIRKDVNPELQALSFMWMNYGAIVTGMSTGGVQPSISMDEFIEESVLTFVRALTPAPA